MPLSDEKLGEGGNRCRVGLRNAVLCQFGPGKVYVQGCSKGKHILTKNRVYNKFDVVIDQSTSPLGAYPAKVEV